MKLSFKNLCRIILSGLVGWRGIVCSVFLLQISQWERVQSLSAISAVHSLGTGAVAGDTPGWTCMSWPSREGKAPHHPWGCVNAHNFWLVIFD